MTGSLWPLCQHHGSPYMENKCLCYGNFSLVLALGEIREWRFGNQKEYSSNNRRFLLFLLFLFSSSTVLVFFSSFFPPQHACGWQIASLFLSSRVGSVGYIFHGGAFLWGGMKSYSNDTCLLQIWFLPFWRGNEAAKQPYITRHDSILTMSTPDEKNMRNYIAYYIVYPASTKKWEIK